VASFQKTNDEVAAASSATLSLFEENAANGKILFTVLGGLAEFERELIRAHRRRPQAGDGAGRQFGRKPKLTPHQALARREAWEPLVEIARSYNVSHSTILRS
jgi:DNA invertase Pin-like site-specific DNA recombinase